MKVGDKIALVWKEGSAFHSKATIKHVNEWLTKRIEETDKNNAGLIPYIDKSYVCETCGNNMGLCNPHSGYCFICDMDDWLPTHLWKGSIFPPAIPIMLKYGKVTERERGLHYDWENLPKDTELYVLYETGTNKPYILRRMEISQKVADELNKVYKEQGLRYRWITLTQYDEDEKDY